MRALIVTTLLVAGCAAPVRDEQDDEALPPVDAGQSDAETCQSNLYLMSRAPGPDGVWATADDQVVAARRRHFSSQLWADREDLYDQVGVDGRWGTGDDGLREWLEREERPGTMQAVLRDHTSPGADGLWHTADDRSLMLVLEGWTGTTMTGATQYDDPGPDGVWETADDVATAWHRFDQPVDGVQRVVLFEAGADGRIRTGDDPAVARFDLLVDETRVITRIFGPGPDGDYDSDDDQILQVRLNDCGASRETFYDGPGPDGQWETDDDEVETMTWRVAGCASACQLVAF